MKLTANQRRVLEALMGPGSFHLQVPAGESDRHWDNQNVGTTAATTCGLCKSELPELGDNDASYLLDRVLGVEIVEECCGAVIDILYREWGERFFEAKMGDFCKDPLGNDSDNIRTQLAKAMTAWSEAIESQTAEFKTVPKTKEK